ncbi:MAG: M23 family peptidase, partial [Novosphingobium sp.]
MIQRLLMAGLGAFALVACSASQAETATTTDVARTTQANAPATPPVQARPAAFSFSGEITQGGWIRGTVPAGTVSVTLGDDTVMVGADGHFFAAFDRDAPASERIVATLRDGSLVQQDIVISPRAWNIEHINAARRPGGPSAAFMERRRPELARINAARSVRAESDGWRQTFIWPVK